MPICLVYGTRASPLYRRGARRGRPLLEVASPRSIDQVPDSFGETRGQGRPVALQKPMHHERIDQAERGMSKRLRQSPDDGETSVLPEPNGALVRRDHEVELHREEASLPCTRERMLAHGL